MKKSTKKKLTLLSLYLFLLFICIHKTTAQQIQKTSQQAATIKFSGMVGHSAEATPIIRLKSIPEKQLIAECSFYGGDTLNGFDIVKKASDWGGNALYPEFRNYMKIKQEEFVNKKYNIAKLPVEVNQNANTLEADQVVGSCSNLDFEDGNFGSWSGTHGYNKNSDRPFIPVYSGISYGTNDPYNSCRYYSLISTKAQDKTDYYGGFPIVSPSGGNYSARLGSQDINVGTDNMSNGWGCKSNADKNAINQVYSCAEDLKQTFVVTAANALLTYQYAVVLNDGGHGPGEQPYFQAVVTNSSGSPLSSCTQYYQQIVSGAVPPGFLISSKVAPYDGTRVCYRPWTYNSVNLTPYMGQTVTIKFISSGCLPGAHFGYAYVDATCGPAQITASNPMACLGKNVTLTSPPVAGGSYKWTGPGIVGSNSGQSAIVNADGTYSVTVTPSQGDNCKYTLSIPVKFSNIIIPVSSLTNVNCYGGNNGSVTVDPSGGNPAYTYSWSPIGGNGVTASGLSPGTYTVKVTDAGGCTKSSTVSITQPTILNNSISSSTNVSCNGGSDGNASATAAGGTAPFSYTWNTSPVQSTSTATGLGLGNYMCTVTDNNGCIKTTTVAIAQPALLTNIVSSTPGGCTVANGTATADPLGGTPGYFYAWTPGGQTTKKAIGLSTGSYTVLVTDIKGCTKTSTVSINSTAAPTAIVSNVKQSTCGNSNGSALASASGGTTGGYLYSWSPGGYTTSQITGLGAGIYKVTVTDSNGCTDTETANVTNADGPKVTTSVNSNVLCFGENTGSATALPSVGTPIYTYLWANGQTSQTATGLSAGTQIVTVKDVNGCVAYFSAFIAQPASALFATVTSSHVLCNGGNNAMAILTPGGGTPGYSYLWNNNQTSHTISGLSAGNYFATITDANGCTIPASVTISQPPTALSVTVPFHTNVPCKGGGNANATLASAGGTPFYTYLWDNGQTTQNIAGLSAGSYSAVVTDANGCTAATSVIISEPTDVLSSAVSSHTNVSCNGGNNATATLSATGGTPGYTFLWNNNQSSSSISGLSAGNYSVTITDSNGCKAAASVSISQPPVLAIGTSSQTDVSCNEGKDGSATVDAIGGTPEYAFLWSNGQTTQTATGLAEGIYTATISDANGCPTSKLFTITQPVKALTVNTATSGSSCGIIAKGIITSAVSFGTAPYSYLWQPGGKTSPVISNILAGNYTLTVTDANGCTEVSTPTLAANTLPVADFSTTPHISCDGGYMQFTDNSTDALSWNWVFGNAGSSSLQNPDFTFPYNATYLVTLIVTNPPCADTISKPVVLSDMSDYFTIAETNVFTPNSDGMNDCFLPALTETGEDNLNLKACVQLEVFDRWGVKMFESQGTDNCWNGNNRKDGKPALDGTYFYIAKLGKSSFKGYVTLLRHR